MANAPEVHVAIQIDLNRLKKQAHRNFIMFNKGKLKVLLLGKNKPMLQYILGVNWPESSFAETDLGVADGHQVEHETAVCVCGKEGC